MQCNCTVARMAVNEPTPTALETNTFTTLIKTVLKTFIQFCNAEWSEDVYVINLPEINKIQTVVLS